MATKPKQPERRSTIRGIQSSPVQGGGYDAVYNYRMYRFLLDDGRTIDVSAITDDSDLRAAVLEWMEATRIAGVVELPAPDPEATDLTNPGPIE